MISIPPTMATGHQMKRNTGVSQALVPNKETYCSSSKNVPDWQSMMDDCSMTEAESSSSSFPELDDLLNSPRKNKDRLLSPQRTPKKSITSPTRRPKNFLLEQSQPPPPPPPPQDSSPGQNRFSFTKKNRQPSRRQLFAAKQPSRRQLLGKQPEEKKKEKKIEKKADPLSRHSSHVSRPPRETAATTRPSPRLSRTSETPEYLKQTPYLRETRPKSRRSDPLSVQSEHIPRSGHESFRSRAVLDYQTILDDCDDSARTNRASLDEFQYSNHGGSKNSKKAADPLGAVSEHLLSSLDSYEKILEETDDSCRLPPEKRSIPITTSF